MKQPAPPLLFSLAYGTVLLQDVGGPPIGDLTGLGEVGRFILGIAALTGIAAWLWREIKTRNGLKNGGEPAARAEQRTTEAVTRVLGEIASSRQHIDREIEQTRHKLTNDLTVVQGTVILEVRSGFEKLTEKLDAILLELQRRRR